MPGNEWQGHVGSTQGQSLDLDSAYAVAEGSSVASADAEKSSTATTRMYQTCVQRMNETQNGHQHEGQNRDGSDHRFGCRPMLRALPLCKVSSAFVPRSSTAQLLASGMSKARRRHDVDVVEEQQGTGIWELSVSEVASQVNHDWRQ